MNLKKLIEPKSMAIYGISKSNPEHPANIIFNKNRNHTTARIYCINPAGGEFRGEKLYRNLKEIGEHVDVAVLAIRSEIIPATLLECIEAGVSGAIIISGGFSEAGRFDLQEQIRSIALEHNFPIIGPNGLGVFSMPFINTFFFPDERFVKPLEGNIGLASQSGGIMVDLMIRFTQEQIGLSRALSIGNKAVIDEIDALRFFNSDPRTDVIGIYFEGFEPMRGREFIEELKKTKKPVVLFKAGKTPSSARAISSHTAAIAGDYFIFSEIIKETDAVEVTSEPDFLSACEALSYYGKRKLDSVAIITASGGHGVIASDYFHQLGINVAQLPRHESDELRDMSSVNIQAIASFSNPIDLTGSTTDDDFITAARYALQRDYIDGIFVLFLPFIPKISSALPWKLSRLRAEFDKPIIAYVPYIPKFGVFIEGFEANGIPVTHSIDSATKMFKAIKRNKG
ncbi:MAG TPA: CoA-binding protein [Spirochaetota bacterium]|nr:CoA-binding protein [Spirochaetota bacterium]HRZ27921.1 CoA-binding protein [Spirochaetota bacterium]HSA14048.1 CoA-binding protein [Spirochaetota bacterium]